MAGKVNESLWRIVRLRPGTVEELRRIEAKLRFSFENGRGGIGPDDLDRISIDAIVCELIRRYEEHLGRGQEARKAARAAKKKSKESVQAPDEPQS